MGQVQRGGRITFSSRSTHSTARLNKQFYNRPLACARGTVPALNSAKQIPKMGQAPVIPRHIRTTLPLLPSGPGGIHMFGIARSPEPEIQISNSRFEIVKAERAGLE